MGKLISCDPASYREDGPPLCSVLRIIVLIAPIPYLQKNVRSIFIKRWHEAYVASIHPAGGRKTADRILHRSGKFSPGKAGFFCHFKDGALRVKYATVAK